MKGERGMGEITRSDESRDDREKVERESEWRGKNGRNVTEKQGRGENGW